ncbi:MAG: sulfotransferase [Ilumatobacteraceae bacterium]
MTERPPLLRIDDLAAPQFSAEVAEIRDVVAALAEGVELEPDAVIAEARAQTGLSELAADDAYHERLAVVLRSLRDEANLGAFGRYSMFSTFTGLVKNRLLVTDLLARHPEIHDVDIARPIVICGLPRTGTTHLHNLMSADPNLRSLPYWESLEPVLSDAERPAPGEPDPRRARCDMAVGMIDASMPLFKRMHEMTTDHVHEEIQLLAVDMSTMLFESMAYVPTWRAYYESHDQTPHYEYLRTLLKVLTFLRGGERWVLKSPQHLEQMVPLARTFPDATFVVTHRDPVSVVVSMVTMLAYGARMSAAVVDPVAIGREWADRLEKMLRAAVRDRDSLPAAQSTDVLFHEFMADDLSTVERVYELADQPLDTGSRQAMADYMADHPRGRFGAIDYDAAQLGLDRGELRERFAFYTDRFAVLLED